MRLKLTVAIAAALITVSAIAAEVSLTDEEQEACAQQGGCLFTSVNSIKARLQAAYEAGLKDGAKKCGAA